MIQLRLHKWSDLDFGVEPRDSITDAKKSSTATFLGRDFPGTRFQIQADEGTRVSAGQVVMCDRRHPQVCFTSPISGVVSRVQRGNRRSLVALKIAADDKRGSIDFDVPSQFSRDNVRKLMQQSGLWTALRCRPYGHVPEPEAEPKALLITAIDTQPLAPDPAVVIARDSDAFSLGLGLLCNLVESPVYLCQSRQSEIDFDRSLRVEIAAFDGVHPTGLVGRHIHALCPIGFDGRQVWHIGYQDVISLGHLMRTGSPRYERVVSLAGSAVNNPRLLSVTLGADVADITRGELIDAPTRILSGPILSGFLSNDRTACLGRFHNQITAVPAGFFDTESGNRTSPLIAIPDLDDVAPPGILATPLLRALLVGDVERALDLGALELVEEDLALLSYHCATRTDYGLLLRNMLRQIEREGLSVRER